MIRIIKPQAPRVLINRGVAQRDQDCKDFQMHANEYFSGKRKFQVSRGIYAHDKVKKTLEIAQHQKCAFCELKYKRVCYGDVEHLRPKGGYRQDEQDTLHFPGYYWLAYEWTNLFASCQLCNEKFKANYYPLADPAKRALCHTDPMHLEENLLIDPAAEDPEQFISFRKQFAYSIQGNPRGDATIKVLGIDRKELNEGREEHLNRLAVLHEFIGAVEDADPTASNYLRLKAAAAKAKQCLEQAVEDTAEYAAATRAAHYAGFTGAGW